MSLYHYLRPTHRPLFDDVIRNFGRMERIYGEQTSSQVVNTDEKFAVNLNVSNFKPEELKINLEGRTLSIQGEQEIKNEHGYSKKSFSKVILLPEDVDVAAVSSNLTEDGKLSIEAPKMEAIRGRSIPIQQTSGEQKPAD